MSQPIETGEQEALPEPLLSRPSAAQGDPAAPAVWSWAEDGGPCEAPVNIAAERVGPPQAPAHAPLEIEIELPAVVEGAVGPYLAFADNERGAPLNRDRPRAGRRSARREPSLLSHLAGIVGGGILGLVIAYYLLNWIGGPQYNFLELNLPGLARDNAETNDESANARSPDWERFVDQPPSGRLMFDDQTAQEVPLAAADSPAAAPDLSDPPATESLPTEDRVGVREAPKFTGDDLREALHAAQDAASMTPQAFAQLCHLGQVVTYLDEQQPDAQVEQRLNAITRLAEKIVRRPGALDQLSKLAVARIREHHGPPTGIVLAGTVMAAGEQGRLHWYQFALDGSDETATVVSRVPAPLAPSDHVLVFGSLVNDPASNLAGYEGQLPQVIWGGWHVKLPAVDGN